MSRTESTPKAIFLIQQGENHSNNANYSFFVLRRPIYENRAQK